VGGSTEARIARLPGIRIGSFDIAGPVVTLGVTQSRGVRSDASGRIGGELLRRFTVAINYRARTMTLVPNGSLAEPFEADMSGISLRMDPDNSLVVARVEEGSPGAESGVRAGDRLLTLDGVAVSQMPLDTVRAAFRREGASSRLRVLRDGLEVEARFVLRRRL
jgi:S1-C subfamily serine protease